jgi:hypothetical protein
LNRAITSTKALDFLYGTDDVTPELVTDLINDSWHLVVDKLPKKTRSGSAGLIVRLRRTD